MIPFICFLPVKSEANFDKISPWTLFISKSVFMEEVGGNQTILP